HAMAGAEVGINRRTAPELYLGLTPVVQRGTGLALGRLTEPDATVPEADSVVDWLVTMRRFDNDCLMSAMAEAGRLNLATVNRLVDELAHFHGSVQPRRQDNTTARFASSLEESLDELRSAPHLFPSTDVAALSQAARQAMARFGPMMDQRGRDGFVRHCHGDLHLRNVYVTADGRPVPFDAAEFSIDLVTVDVWDDLAYLLMDLWHRGARHLANGAMNRYAENTADYAGMAPLPLYLAARAVIRAKVAASAHALAPPGGRAALAHEARAYLRSARLFLAPRPPRLAAIGGLSGTGKTTLARALAPDLGTPPGALVLRSDVTRKIMAGAGRLDR
ncbi:MAG: phosphotransferase, partial [Alphaproteobacteria bacterium]